MNKNENKNINDASMVFIKKLCDLKNLNPQQIQFNQDNNILSKKKIFDQQNPQQNDQQMQQKQQFEQLQKQQFEQLQNNYGKNNLFNNSLKKKIVIDNIDDLFKNSENDISQYDNFQFDDYTKVSNKSQKNQQVKIIVNKYQNIKNEQIEQFDKNIEKYYNICYNFVNENKINRDIKKNIDNYKNICYKFVFGNK
jgi:hypothetical protein